LFVNTYTDAGDVSKIEPITNRMLSKLYHIELLTTKQYIESS